MKTYVCRKIRLYQYLSSKGYVPYKTCIDKYNCKRLVWLYDDSDGLRDAVEEYYAQIA